ncbi:MAG TPA: molybdopterin-dependent oxidoreductase [Burkholderiales bacterium]|nr:molybdopterin-dependent oxidoreductase [Burkholderiales bacterium]
MTTETRSTCAYCGVGCGVIIESADGRITDVRGDAEHPANFGRLCTKGSTLHLSAQTGARARYPELRRRREDERVRVDWDSALDFAAERFAGIIEAHGPDSVAFYVSGQFLTEDYYVFNKLAKGLIGTNNIDTNSRLCMSSAVSAYKIALGADGPPGCYEDIELTDCVLIAGSNMAYAHPVLFRRLEEARERRPQMKIIAVDPRRTDTAASADLHLAIQPGTDVALFNAMLHVLLAEGLCDLDHIADHSTGFDALRELVANYAPEIAAKICAVRSEDIRTAARWFGQSKAALSLYCQGLNQSIHGTDKNLALINLHLATGQIARPGAGPFSLTGQPNAMGGREVGGMATLLSGHRDLANPVHREEVARLWGVPSVPATPGKTAVEMFEAVRSGEIKAIWIACTNPVHSMPQQARVVEALRRAEFVVVQDAFHTTDTTAFADLLLPATSWGEKGGTVTNSERRISRVQAAVAAPGEARHDWRIGVDFAHRLATRLGHDGTPLFPYERPEQIFNEHRESTRGRDLDITGLSYALLETRGPQQWPFPDGASVGKAWLYEDRCFATADGRARFTATPYLAPAEEPDSEYPLRLTTGRLRDQWHGMSRSGTVARLFSHVEAPALAMHPHDLRIRGLQAGELVRVANARGELILPVEADESLLRGQVHLAMHWGAQFMNGAGSNALTSSAFDAQSQQPELKHAVVQVSRFEAPRQIVAMRSAETIDEALARLDAVRPLLKEAPYASCVLHGRDRPVLVYRAASPQPIASALIERLDRALDLHEHHATMAYDDARRNVSKHALVCDARLLAVRLVGEIAAADWLKELMASESALPSAGAWMLAPVSRPLAAQDLRGRTVCSCLDVSENDIRGAIDAGANLSTLQMTLGCGTGCGFCVPEIKRMIVARAPATTAERA